MAFLLDEKKNLTLIKQIISRKNELSADYLYEGTTIYSHSILLNPLLINVSRDIDTLGGRFWWSN